MTPTQKIKLERMMNRIDAAIFKIHGSAKKFDPKAVLDLTLKIKNNYANNLNKSK